GDFRRAHATPRSVALSVPAAIDGIDPRYIRGASLYATQGIRSENCRRLGNEATVRWRQMRRTWDRPDGSCSSGGLGARPATWPADIRCRHGRDRRRSFDQPTVATPGL